MPQDLDLAALSNIPPTQEIDRHQVGTVRIPQQDGSAHQGEADDVASPINERRSKQVAIEKMRTMFRETGRALSTSLTELPPLR